jgi:hypothetical protein
MYPSSEEDRVQYWLGQLGFAQARMKPLFRASEVLINQFYGDPSSAREQNQEDDSEDQHLSRVKSGIVYGWIDQSVANMVDRNPIFQLSPETEEAARKVDPSDPNSPSLALGAGKIVNYRYRETNQLRVDERTVQDAFLCPYGVAKLGYSIDMDKRFQDFLQGEDVELVLDDPEDENLFLGVGTETKVTEFQDQRGHIYSHRSYQQSELIMLPAEQADSISALIDQHCKIHEAFMFRKQPNSNTNVRYEAPFAVHWQPDMFLTDVFCLEGPQDARWIAFGWELPIEEVQADSKYENVKDLTPSRWKEAPEKKADYSDGFDIVRGWEVWAKNFPVGRGKFMDIVFTVAEDHKKFLNYHEEWPYTNLDDYPAETLVFQPGMRSWYYKSPLLMGGADSTQGLVNEILDSYLNIVRKTKNIWLVDPQSGITTKIMQDILDAPDGSVIEVPGLGDAGGRSVIPLPFLAEPPDRTQLLGIVQQMFDRSMGTPQPMQLGSSATATESSIYEKRNTSRENRRAGLLSEFQLRKARKMWQLDTQYQPDRLFLLDKYSQTFVKMSPEMARGEFGFTMDITSHATAISVERSQWMDLLNLFAGLTPVMIQTFGMPPNLPELARRLLVRGFNDRMAEEILPMLQNASQKMQDAGAPGPAGAEGAQQQGAQPGPDMAALAGIMGQGSGTEFANPEAQGAQEAVKNGRMGDRNIGPLNRDTFNRAAPSEGRLEGAQGGR